MYAKYGHQDDDYVAALYENPESGDYIITFHHGEMPAFGGESFPTLEQAKSWAREHLGITHWRGLDGQFTASPE